MKRRSALFGAVFWCALLTAGFTLLALAFTFQVFPLSAAGFTGRGMYLWLLAMLLVACGLALIAARLAAGVFSRRIRRLQKIAENLLEAEAPPESLRREPEDELGLLARDLRRAASHWEELVQRLRVESSQRDAILKSMVEGVLAVDRDLRVIFCNDSFARLVGAQTPIPPQTPLLSLVRDPSLAEIISGVLATSQPSRKTLQLSTAGAPVFHVEAAPLSEAAGRGGAVAILHDVTELERLERVRKDFVANVSHELRTPLTAIRGYAESLLDGALEDQDNARRFAEVILAHSVRLNNIASDLLILAELESGGKRPALHPVPLRAAAATALRAVANEALLHNIRIEAGDLADESVLGVERYLEQVLINLLANAIKFNRPGGRVRMETGRTDADQIFICVSDDGVGIPSEDLSRIFERFYRVDRARSREVGGTGLGLSIVKHAVEHMGGAVTVESRLGKGSTFTVLLSACKPSSTAALQSSLT